MRSMRLRLTLWYGIGFIAVSAAYIFLLYFTVETALLQKYDGRRHPGPANTSLTTAEVHEVAASLVRSALLWVSPVVLVAIAGGYWLARQSLRPIANVNRQLQSKNPGNLGQPISLPEVDLEFRDLLRQLNDLLSRLDSSFAEMNNYAAKVAHELRTPLSIMRLKVEQAGERIAPELAEELENELHRLTHVVDQSLLIARAEQGRILPRRSVFDFSSAITEVVADFQLLAAGQDRKFTLKSDAGCWVSADPRHLRQIAHTLLTNALKHGSGDLTVRLKRHPHSVVLLVSNRITHTAHPESTLGLGLRVVAALLRLEPQVRLQRRYGSDYHATLLRIPLVEQTPSFQT
ncbi:MAG: histidine kinase dimerization/phospho-acceptor domain-containing protein [Verrucomicrobiae bacterium]|nr:histidine kinase dimerization/phospho-acceptor domain-containing protein [Verrucomicrobiae bacterium]